MGIITPGHLDQFIDDMFRGGLIGIAHAEVDDVLAARAGLSFQVVDDVEDIGRQAFDALKVSVQSGVSRG